MSLQPKVAEFPLAILALEPVKLHVVLFGGLCDDFIINEAVRCFFSYGWAFVVADDLFIQLYCAPGLLFGNSKIILQFLPLLLMTLCCG